MTSCLNKRNKIPKILIALSFLSFSLLGTIEAKSREEAYIDILVFSPHPDDETLCCGGTILKAIQDNKKVNVVFLTNGDGYSDACSAWLKKERKGLCPEDYIVLGEERQKEALRATKKLGLSEDNLIFLSYPDSGLSLIWEERYNAKSSPPHSPYKRTYRRARVGYNRENLTNDIKEILKKYKPKRIYTPSPLDRHKDHIATTEFVNRALDQLKYEDNDWINSLDVFYYIIHSRVDFSWQQNYKEDIASFKNQKTIALREYRTQLNLEQERRLQESLIKKNNELFWKVPNEREAYLNEVYKEWVRVAKIMKGYGYNINLGVVADVADDIEDSNIVLVKRQKIFSQNPNTVSQLALKVVEGLNSGGIIPVVKHFPGLGRSRYDTHTWLPKVKVSKEELYQRDLLPFKKLIKEKAHFWIMVNHTIYSCLDNKPASLSYKVQTGILRKELGFNGIIIVDELLNMQAIREYAFQQEIKEPCIGEIVAMAFQAGADIVIIYPLPEKAEEVVTCVIEAVKQAAKEGRIKEKEINVSLKRILKEKERIFKKPLRYLLKDMSLDEKIAQKLIIDTYEDIGLLNKYNLGGIHARDYRVIKEAQRNSKIPLFIAGQHEGGKVNEVKLKIYTQSAYLTGREFERTFVKKGAEKSLYSEVSDKGDYNKSEEPLFNFNQLSEDDRQVIIHILSDSVDEQIRFYSELKEGKILPPPHPHYLSPLTIYQSNIGMRVDFKPFEDLPILWLRKFPDKEAALCAYQLFKETHNKWTKNPSDELNRKRFDCYLDKLIYELNLLKEEIKNIKPQRDKRVIRVLCLAAHPDDEDGEALTYFRNKFNCETYILLATRGGGGENEISSCLYKELGFLRTEEVEKAASILGVKKVYYLGKNDFGYCLNPDEAFKEWNREDTLEKLVYFFRLIRPHIIITRHSKSNPHEHCQDRALVVLAEEAFDLAGDSQAYPELTKNELLPWQPLRFYQRSRDKKDFPLDDIVINTQEYISLEQKTYHQIALEALNQHRSQGNLSFLCPPGRSKIAYQLVKSKSFPQAVSSSAGNLLQEKGRIVPSGFPGVKIVNNLRIGLIEKNNNILFVALKSLGCNFKRLDEGFLRAGDLSQFDTIVVGQGVYTALPALAQTNGRLIEFVKKGGSLVVFSQYNRGRDTFSFTPYPLKMSFNPITDENAPITILIPEHPLFNFPNKISAQDFDGWVQDRGNVSPFEYSDKYTELLSCPTPTGQLIKGGYLVAHYGKGSYIYTTYAWYRQFRELHLGAYKNLSNMLAYHFAAKSNQSSQPNLNY